MALAAADPTPGAPGIIEGVALPTFPRPSLVAPNALWASKPVEPVWRHVNAMSAWQSTIIPPPPAAGRDEAMSRRGRDVFDRVGCSKCHAGPFLTNNRVLPLEEVGTEGDRAKALRRTGELLQEPLAYPFDLRLPLPPGARTVRVPTDKVDPGQVSLAYAIGNPGGYKVPALVGLWWTAPYLHDGGVAVGPGADGTPGVPCTLLSCVTPDAANSLRALVDRGLRAKVIAANRASAALRAVRVDGGGHEFWADGPAGVSPDEQAALVHYLLHVHGARQERAFAAR